MSATAAIDFGAMKLRPLDEIAAELGKSRRTMFRLIAELELTRYVFPGSRRVHLDADELKRKLRQPQKKD